MVQGHDRDARRLSRSSRAAEVRRVLARDLPGQLDHSGSVAAGGQAAGGTADRGGHPDLNGEPTFETGPLERTSSKQARNI